MYHLRLILKFVFYKKRTEKRIVHSSNSLLLKVYHKTHKISSSLEQKRDFKRKKYNFGTIACAIVCACSALLTRALAPSLRKNDTQSFLLAHPCRKRRGIVKSLPAKRKSTAFAVLFVLAEKERFELSLKAFIFKAFRVY